MARQKKIQDFSLLYATLRYYVDLVLKLSYRNIRYVGRENIPQDGAVIYAPNHTNALMDAMVILAMDRKAKVFVARADIFKKAKILASRGFLKISARATNTLALRSIARITSASIRALVWLGA